jgi:DNA-binding transcriptional LysR family regulator
MDNQKSRLDLNALRTFLAVVEHRGFRGAATQLGQPKSTVSRRVSELEAALGQQLLRRTTRTVTLTDVGEAFARQVSPALGSLEDAVKVLQQTTDTPRGVLRVTAPPTFAENFLGDFMARFARQYPDIRLTLDLNDRYVDLIGEGFDVALRAGVLPDSSLRARLLAVSPTRCFASAAYLKRKGTPKTPAELIDHDVLAFGTDESTAKWPFEVRGRKKLVALRPQVTVNSFLLLKKLAEDGLGITRLPVGLIQTQPSQVPLVEVLQDFAAPASPMHAVYPPGKHLSPRVRVFLDALGEYLVLPSGVKPLQRSAK